MTQLIVFFTLTTLAVVGALEWFKSATWKLGLPSWVMPVVSLVICLVLGIFGAYAGFLSSFAPIAGYGTLLGGILLGFVALACVELAYQLLVQLVFALIKAATRGLNSLFDGSSPLSKSAHEVVGRIEDLVQQGAECSTDTSAPTETTSTAIPASDASREDPGPR